MVFSSAIFLYAFLPLFLLVYGLAPRSGRSWVLALGSYVFYGWWRPDFVLLMLFSTVLDHEAGRGIARAQDRGARGRRWLGLSVVVNLGLLAYFKYADFGVATWNALVGSHGGPVWDLPRVVLPVGISFYTFQTLSYTVDVYRGVVRPVDRFADFMAYVAMFPQLVAGPIVRYKDVAEQLRHRTHSWSNLYTGVLFFQCGLAKKVLLADVLDPFVDQAFDGPAPGTSTAWLALAAYSLQIYWDFSGYSDMALGLGRMLGFHFPANFESPYRSQSITEFWRRWHISLSTWLRDYLYVPLGGNRRGPWRTQVHLMVTMLLGGLWHGAAGTFVVWGAWHGLWLALERVRRGAAWWGAAPGPVRVGLTLLVVMLGWVWFRAPDLAAAGAWFQALAGGGPGGPWNAPGPLVTMALTVGGGLVFLPRTSQALIARDRALWVATLQGVFVVAVLQLHRMNHVPFLYFRF